MPGGIGSRSTRSGRRCPQSVALKPRQNASPTWLAVRSKRALSEPKQENPVSLTWLVPSGVLRGEPRRFARAETGERDDPACSDCRSRVVVVDGGDLCRRCDAAERIL